MSWAAPGTKRRIFGSRRSMVICLAPSLCWLLARFGFSRLSSAIAPLCLACMSNRPIRVSLTTSVAEMQEIIASQLSRRASSHGRTAWM